MGVFCWVDWIPYVDQALLMYINYFIIILFLLNLFENIKYLFPLNNTQKIFIVYLIYTIVSTMLKGYLFSLNTILVSLIVFLILSRKNSGTKHLINGFVFGGFLTALYMILMIFDLIKVTDFSALNQFDFGDYFLNNKDMITSIGFTNKYNKLSYLFSFLICIIVVKLNFKAIFKYTLVALIVYLQIKTTGRGGLLVSILYITILSILYSKKRYISIPLLIIGISYMINSVFFQAISNRLVADDSSALSRLSQYSYAFENFNDNLIFGIGYRPLYDIIGTGYIHNFFLNNLIMGGVIGFVLASLFIVTLIKKIINSKMPKELKVFLFLLIFMQTMFENFNLILAMGSYVLVWLLIVEYDVNKNITLNNKYEK